MGNKSIAWWVFEDEKRWTGLSPCRLPGAAALLDNELRDLRLKVHVSGDMIAFNDVKTRVRGFPVAPMHHHAVGVFGRERAFWMYLTDEAGEVVGLQAFRYDEIDTHLADWCLNYMIGVYMRQQELMVPSFPTPARRQHFRTFDGQARIPRRNMGGEVHQEP